MSRLEMYLTSHREVAFFMQRGRKGAVNDSFLKIIEKPKTQVNVSKRINF